MVVGSDSGPIVLTVSCSMRFELKEVGLALASLDALAARRDLAVVTISALDLATMIV